MIVAASDIVAQLKPAEITTTGNARAFNNFWRVQSTFAKMVTILRPSQNCNGQLNVWMDAHFAAFQTETAMGWIGL